MVCLLNRHAVLAVSLVGASTALAACKSNNNNNATVAPIVAAHIIPVNGANQTVAVGAALGDSLALIVTGPDGQAVPGVVVSWSIKTGGGSLSSDSTTSDASGRAAVSYKAGTVPGTAAVLATAASLSPVEFDATLIPAAPASMAGDATDPTTLMAGAAPTLLEVRLSDQFGNAIPGATVNWTIATGDTGDALDATSSITDANGLADVHFSTDTVPGERTVTAATPTGVTTLLNFNVVSDSSATSSAIRRASALRAARAH